jgi:hypothetical protein
VHNVKAQEEIGSENRSAIKSFIAVSPKNEQKSLREN